MSELAEQSCGNKMSFDTEKEARTAATVAELQRGIKLKPYRCKKCGLWHNTTRYDDP